MIGHGANVPNLTGDNQISIGNKIYGLANGRIGIGTTSPWAKLSVAGDAAADIFYAASSTATSTFMGGLNVGNGAIVYDYSSGITSIQNLALGNMSFEADSGIVTWTDMPVTASSSYGTVNSYSANLDGDTLLSIYGESDGAGGVQRTGVGIGTTSPWARLAVDTSNLSSTTFAFVVGSSTRNFMTISNTGFGTTTVSGLNILGSATSTSNVGFNITSGCFAVNGTCITAAAGSSASSTLLADVNTWSNLQRFNSGLLALGSTTIGNGSLTGGLTVSGVATTTLLAVYGASGNAGVNAMFQNTNAAAYSGFNLLDNTGAAQAVFAYGNASVPLGANAAFLSTNGRDFGISNALTSNNANFVMNGATGRIGIGTTTPNAKLSIFAPVGETNTTLFNISSSTGLATTTLFAINNTGVIDFNPRAQSGDKIATFNGQNFLSATSSATGLLTLGYQAGQALIATSSTNISGNTAIGFQALSTATSSNFNTAVGYLTLKNTADYTAQNNTALGYQALTTNVTGSRNTAIGSLSLQSNATGTANTAVGYLSSYRNTGAISNTAVGNAALYGNSVGYGNVALGNEALNGNYSIYSASGNTAIGQGAGFYVQSNANYNTLLGYQAGNSITTGSYNILIGQSVEAPSGAASTRQLNVGNVIYGTNMYNGASTSSGPIANGTIGVGTTSPFSKLGISLNNGDTLSTAFIISSSTASATTTLFSISNTGSTTINGLLNVGGSASSTFANGLTVRSLALTGTATSTAANGFNIAAGCFAINGTCISGGAGSNFFTNSGASTFLSTGSNLGIGSSTPFARLAISLNSGETSRNAFSISSSTGSASTTIFNVANTGQVTVADGSATLPAYSFVNETNTGLYRSSSQALSVAVNGNEIVRFGATYLSPNNSVNQGFALLGTGNGSASTPSYSFSNDINTGMYTVGSDSDIIAFATAGIERLRLDATGNVGIGTSSPVSNLSVFKPYGNTNTTLFSIASSTNAAGSTNVSLFSIDRTGTSTLFGNASSSYLTVSSLNAASCDLKATTNGTVYCGTDANGGVGGAWPFTPSTNFGVAVQATSTPFWLQGGLMASSTSYLSTLNLNGAINIAATTSTSTIATFGGQSFIIASSTGDNTALGINSLGQVVNAARNVALGNNALSITQSGTENTAIGNLALQTLGNNIGNTAVGYGAMQLGTGNSNTAIGFAALKTNAGHNNVALGNQAGFNTSGGSNNILIGAGIDAPILSGSDQLNIGDVLFGDLSSLRIGVGTSTLYAKLTVAGDAIADNFIATSTTATSTFAGSLNVGNGAISYDNSSGLTSIQNLALGNMSFDSDAGIVSWTDLPVTSSASAGTVESYSAQIDGNPLLTLYSESDGSGGVKNLGVGIGSTTPWANLVVQKQYGDTKSSLFAVSSSTESDGTSATVLFSIGATGSTTAANGFNITAGCYAVNGTCLTAGGSSASSTLLSTDTNTFTNLTTFTGGLRAFASSTIGAGGAATGLTISGGATTTGNAYFAGLITSLAPTATSSVFNISNRVFITASTTGYNTSVGLDALAKLTSGANNSAFGATSTLGAGAALYSNTTGNNNTAFGAGALARNTIGSNNVAIGTDALCGLVQATSSVAIGYLAGSTYGCGSTGANTIEGLTIVGTRAGRTGANAHYNTLIGYQSAGDNSTTITGNSNIMLGTHSAPTAAALSTGSRNIGIGTDIWFAGGITANDQLNIGGLILGSLPATSSTAFVQPVLGSVGIGTTSPTSRFGISLNSGGTHPFAFLISSTTPTATSSLFAIDNQGRVGISTTSPLWALTAANASRPQLALTDGTGSSNAWTFRSINNSLYIATSTGSATSSQPIITITPNASIGFGTTSPTTQFGARYAFSDPIFVGKATSTLNATSTFMGNLQVHGTLKIGPNSTYITEEGFNLSSAASGFAFDGPVGTALSISNSGFGTTTLSGLSVVGSATSTSNVGFNLTGGCFSINGTCLGGGGVSTAGNNTWTGANIFAASTTIGNGTATGGLTVSGTGTTTNLAITAAAGCSGGNALQTSASGLVTCGAITLSGASAGGGWNASGGSANGKIIQATSTYLVAMGAATSTPYAQLTVTSGATATTTLALVAASGQTADIFQAYNSSGAIAFSLKSDGRLGIGTTSPLSMLSIQKNFGATTTNLFSISSSTATNGAASQLFTVSNTGQTTLFTEIAGPQLTFQNAAGDISGFNMTGGTMHTYVNGLSKLEVGTALTRTWSDNGFQIFSDGTATAPSLGFIFSPGTGLYAPSTEELGITANGIEHIRVQATTTGALDFSRVGIGTTSPWGNAGLRDQLTVAGRIYSTWKYADCDFGGMNQTNTALSATAQVAGFCGPFAYIPTSAAAVTVQSITTNDLTESVSYLSFGSHASQGVGTTIGSVVPFTSATSSPTLETVVQNVTRNATSSFIMVGFNGVLSNTNPVIGREADRMVSFVASTTQTNWFAVVRNGTSRTAIDTGVASTTVVNGTSTLQRLRIELSPGNATFMINGRVVAQTASNIPSASLGLRVSIASAITPTATQRPLGNVAKLGLVSLRLWVDDPPTIPNDGLLTDGTNIVMPQEPLEDWAAGSNISVSYKAENSETLRNAYGTIVSINPATSTQVVASSRPYDDKAIGVISNSFAQNLGYEYAGIVKVAQIGRAVVLVTNENGPIAPGDAITSSSIAGLGMKATRPGQIIGHALTAYDPEQLGTCGFVDITGTTCQGEILVDLAPGFNMNVAPMAETAVHTMEAAMAHLASSTEATLGDLGSVVFGQITAQVAIVKDFFADKIFANRVETKELCVEDVCVTKEQFLLMLQTASAGTTGGNNGGSSNNGGSGNTGGDTGGDTDGGTGTTTPEEAPDTEAPVVSLNGSATVLILVGDTYSDLGAVVTDNVYNNLGFTVSLDGGAPIDLSQLSLDTAAAGEHTLVFTATDSAGNVGTATRTIIVNAPSFGGGEGGEENPQP